jgi:hypothetical protein
MEEVCSLSGPHREVISKGQDQFSQFCTGVCEERTWAAGRGMVIVEAVTRKRLLKDWEH